MAKAKKTKPPKEIKLPNDKPLKTDLTFEQVIKLAAKTQYKKPKK